MFKIGQKMTFATFFWDDGTLNYKKATATCSPFYVNIYQRGYLEFGFNSFYRELEWDFIFLIKSIF